MPRFKIETSLFEPVTIEVEGGRTFESAPLSPSMLKEVDRIEEQKKAGALNSFSAVVQQIALIFGLEPNDVETTDVRILTRMLEDVMMAMKESRARKIAEVPSPSETAKPEAAVPSGGVSGATEAEAEKNASKPGVTQLP